MAVITTIRTPLPALLEELAEVCEPYTSSQDPLGRLARACMITHTHALTIQIDSSAAGMDVLRLVHHWVGDDGVGDRVEARISVPTGAVWTSDQLGRKQASRERIVHLINALRDATRELRAAVS